MATDGQWLMGVRENKVERYLKTSVENIGGITRKWVSPGRDGVTDQITMHFGKVWLVEVKTFDGKLSVAQIREHQRLRDAGMQVRTVYGDVGVDRLILEMTLGIVDAEERVYEC